MDKVLQKQTQMQEAWLQRMEDMLKILKNRVKTKDNVESGRIFRCEDRTRENQVAPSRYVTCSSHEVHVIEQKVCMSIESGYNVCSSSESVHIMEQNVSIQVESNELCTMSEGGMCYKEKLVYRNVQSRAQKGVMNTKRQRVESGVSAIS